MGIRQKTRLKGPTRLKNRNITQKLAVGGRCASVRCRALAAQAERYRLLNEELVREITALRAAEKSNQEFSVMFDRFLLKMGQSIPFVQGLKRHLEFAYDNLAQIETMVDCFTDPGSLRKFLVGDESFMFEPVPGDDDKGPPRSPLVKDAPQREHRRFDDNGEIDTILEQNGEDEENRAINYSHQEKSTLTKAPQCLEATAVAQRRSSRRSSIGVSRLTVERTRNKSPSEPSEQQSANTSTNSEEETSAKLNDLRTRRSSSRFSFKSPMKRATYCKVPPPPPSILISAASFNESSLQSVEQERDSAEIPEDSTMPAMGKSDEELTGCFETTLVEAKIAPVETPKIHERSPTAINVAQVWAAANVFRPVERSPTCTNVAAAFREALEERQLSQCSSPSINNSTAPLATTQFPSPVVCEKLSSLPTSTPALDQRQNQPSSPELSIIVAETESPEQEAEMVIPGNVDCRRRKRLMESPRISTNFRHSETLTAMRRSVRFANVSEDSDSREQSHGTTLVNSVATTSSPYVRNVVKKTRRMRPSRIAVDENSEEEHETLKAVNSSEQAGPSVLPAPRKTFVKRKCETKSIGKKRSGKQISKLDPPSEPEETPANANNATYLVDNHGPPTPKRIRVTSGNQGVDRDAPRSSVQRASSTKNYSSTLSDESSTDSRRRSRRAASISYAEPSLRAKLRRDR